VVVYPKFLDRLDAVLATGDISSSDPDQSRWAAYVAILTQSLAWAVGIRPTMLREGEWMEDAKRIAVAGYGQVLEDGQDKCNSEGDAEYSDHGEVLEGIYVNGATPASGRLTTEQAIALRAAGRSVQGRAGGPVIVPGAGQIGACRQCSNASLIPVNVIILGGSTTDRPDDVNVLLLFAFPTRTCRHCSNS
jgi:hypothetical protein